MKKAEGSSVKKTLASELNLNVVITEYEKEHESIEFLAHGKSVEYLDSYGQILNYLAARGSARANFRHYSTRKRIASILGKSAFYLTDGSNWNDEYDKNRFNPPFSAYKRFGICLSATTSESIAMWMLYGGIDGNGAMINFDKTTLKSAMSQGEYQCGFFAASGEFNPVLTLDAEDLKLKLVDVLYFSQNGDESITIERIGEKKQARLNANAFADIEQIAKHKAWSYEREVRLVATVDKLTLGNKASKVTAIKVPFEYSQSFVESRVFDSPMSDGGGDYRDSELQGTVEWDLCKDCARV